MNEGKPDAAGAEAQEEEAATAELTCSSDFLGWT